MPTAGFAVGVVSSVPDLPKVQVLVDRLTRLHPGVPISVLVVQDDGRPLPTIDGATTLSVRDLGDPAIVNGLRYGLTLPELVEVLPFLVARHLTKTHEVVLHLGLDTVPLRDLTDLAETSPEADLVTVARRRGALPDDGLSPTTADLLRDGVLETGCFVVRRGAGALLDWMVRDVVRPPGPALDRAASLFSEVAVSERGWTVSRWDLPGRDVRSASVLVLDGFDPRAPHLLSTYDGPAPRVLLSADPVLRDLCREHADAVLAAGWSGAREVPFAALGGVAVEEPVRALILDELRGHGTRRLDLATLDEASFVDWASAPSGDLRDPPGLGRYLAHLYAERIDLREHFPEVSRGKLRRYLRWVRLHGDEAGVPAGVIARSAEQRRAIVSRGRTPHPLVPGVEVVGHLSAESGLGEAARMLVAGLEAADTPVSTTTYARTESRQDAAWVERPAPDGALHDVVLVCVNAAALPRYLRHDEGAAHLAGRYVVGLWFWELDAFPEADLEVARGLDEIWVTSEFSAGALRERTDRPVHVVPLPVRAPAPGEPPPAEPGFTFGFVFDFNSVLHRKNPAAVVRAFVEAFPAPGEARLVLKSVNGDVRRADREELLAELPDRPDVVLRDGYTSRAAVDRLMHAIDCYVSLHRSEGFGLTLAEAMAIGNSTIATGYSGNLQFMTSANSVLVPYELVPVGPGNEPYDAAASWAEPDVAFASRAMRAIVDDADLRARLGNAARESIAAGHSVEAMASFARDRLAEIRRQRVPATPPRRGVRRFLARR